MCLLFLIIIWIVHEERQQLYFLLQGCYIFTFPVNLFMKFKFRKNLRDSNFSCSINKELVNLISETNSKKFNNFANFKIKLALLNLKPFEVCKCVRLCTLLGSASSWTNSKTCDFQIKLFPVSVITFGRIQWLLWANSIHTQLGHF